MPSFKFDCHRRIGSAWKPHVFVMKGPLTDKKIEQYRAAGYYSKEFREARKELMQQKAAKRQKREGNFNVAEDGRLIYAP